MIVASKPPFPPLFGLQEQSSVILSPIHQLLDPHWRASLTRKFCSAALLGSAR